MSFNEFFVIPEYCNGVRFEHRHETIHTAAQEYCERLSDALEPGRTAEVAPHVRQVTLELRDTEEERVRTVATDVFGCEHNPVKA